MHVFHYKWFYLFFYQLYTGKPKLGQTFTDGSYKEDQNVDKHFVTESMHVNRTYDSNAACSTDHTPVRFQMHVFFI